MALNTTRAVFIAGILCCSYALDLLKYHKEHFERTFHDRCDKYPFVSNYVRKIESSDERYLTFVYQENGLKNGGLGDKIGGLVSAVAMAIRFNRTLIIRSQNDMHEVFRPYHPTDIHSETPKYSWTNITQWSHYDWKYANRDETEYDLYDCINNTGQKNGHCSMKDGDAHTPHILYRSNRAYLCYYDNQKGSVANREMAAILGVNSSSNLYEVAGCMLRLALWPTESLWAEVGKQLKEFELTLPTSARRARRKLLRTNHAHPVRKLEPSPEPSNVLQVGMHFRCGDKSYIKKGGYDHMCVYSEDETAEAKASMFPLGNPYEMGVCARRSIHSLVTASLLAAPSAGAASTDATTAVQSVQTVQPASLSSGSGDAFAMGFIASDNLMSSLQMNVSLGLPHSIISPQGCHVEMDPSKQCHMFTVSQWFMLSLSDILVTQEGMPSSFSRYAGIYGLKTDPFRNGKNCDSVETTMEASRKPMSNWFC